MKAAAASAGSKAANVAGTMKRSLSFSKRKPRQRLEEDSEDGRGESSDFAQHAPHQDPFAVTVAPSGFGSSAGPAQQRRDVSSSSVGARAERVGQAAGQAKDKIVRSLSFGKRKPSSARGTTITMTTAYAEPYDARGHNGFGTSVPTSVHSMHSMGRAQEILDPPPAEGQGRLDRARSSAEAERMAESHAAVEQQAEMEQREQEELDMALAMSMSMSSLEHEHRNGAANNTEAQPPETEGAASADDQELQRALELSRHDNRAPAQVGDLLGGGDAAPAPTVVPQPAAPHPQSTQGDLAALFAAPAAPSPQQSPIVAVASPVFSPVAYPDPFSIASAVPIPAAATAADPFTFLAAPAPTPTPTPASDPFGAMADPFAPPSGFPSALSMAAAPPTATPMMAAAAPQQSAAPFAALAAPAVANPFGAPAPGASPFGAPPPGASPFGAPPPSASPFGCAGGAPESNPFAGF